ncbi:unnamed protein product [Amoebophrya sp. A25]|nr:unnamed protein product [Amoebophrya sp. A25]|eukprot:GSA25T00020749001.1
MRHARKAALLLADAQERTRELQSLAEQVVLQARYLQENPKALCTGIPNLDGELLGETDHDGIPAAATLHWATR